MRAIHFVAPVLFACGTSESPPADPCESRPSSGREIELRVMTINMRHDDDQWEKRMPLLADEIARLKPDLIGMQEVKLPKRQAELLNDLVRQRTNAPLYELQQELKPGLAALTGEGIGILSRFPIEASESIDIDFGRLVLYTRLRTPDGDAIDLFDTHLHYSNDDDRLAQAKRTTEFIAGKDVCPPKFLTGDMNSVDSAPAIRHFLSEKLVDTYVAVHGLEGTAREGATASVVPPDGGLDRISTDRIDYVFARGREGQITYTDSVVCFNKHDDAGIYPSDHYGVMTTMRVRF
jgi:endonuclease/exonuclease/phosphatase family metal-dependent hydrolase